MKNLIAFLFFLLSFSAFSQEHKKGETLFGIEFKFLVPISILNAGPQELGNDSIAIKINSDRGYAFGAIIRHNFSKMFTLETGIRVTKRYFPIDFSQKNTGQSESSSIELNMYEIPVQWLLYIRLGEQFYMNTLFGVSLNFYPSDVTKTESNYSYYFLRKSWIHASILASVGFEYRTKKSGYLYLGASILRPFTEIGTLYFSYYHDGVTSNDVNFNTLVSGTYLSVDLRYFFNKKEKTVEPKYY